MIQKETATSRNGGRGEFGRYYKESTVVGKKCSVGAPDDPIFAYLVRDC